MIYFGNGIPSNFFFVDSGQNVAQLAGALDIAAHELTHAVTSSSSNLIYLNESGALNEAFSDIMGTSVEFFYQTPGTGRGQADYLIGEDVFRALRPGSVNGIRSMENPGMFGDPDHYSRRFTGTGDNGGVHINSGIPNHVFYLAIESGTNRTSGLFVTGVGAANREQIEKVFYRAFVFLLPANATFSTARAATIQAARDLYPTNAAVLNAVTQAWTAVGVN
jgi:thermolysin